MIISSSRLPLRTHMKTGVALDVFADQRQGMRPTQEDGCLIRRLGNAVLLGIADGVAGHPAGDHAARIALETLDAAFPDEDTAITPWEASERLVAAFEAAHRAVVDFGILLGAEKRPCTTLTAAVILPRLGVFAFASAGDSHLYVMGPQRPISRLNALQEDDRGRLTSCIGGRNLVINGQGELHLLSASTTLLIATDGLDILPSGQVEAVLRGAASATLGTRRLLELVEAHDHPRQDNTSLVVVRLSAAGAVSSPRERLVAGAGRAAR